MSFLGQHREEPATWRDQLLALLQQQRYAEAIPVLPRMIEIVPSTFTLGDVLSKIYVKLRRCQDALDACERAGAQSRQ